MTMCGMSARTAAYLVAYAILPRYSVAAVIVEMICMPNEYRYGIHDGLSREELFLLVAIDETCKQLGVDDVVAVGAILAGQRFIPTRGKFNGAVKGTSVASVVSR